MRGTRVTLLFAVGLLAAAYPGLSAAQVTAYVVRESAAPCLKVRTSPDADASVIECVDPGTRLEAVGAAPYWRHVRLPDGTDGWAAKKYLDSTSDAVPPDTSGAAPAEREDAWLEVHVVDVGQGDGIWVRTFDDGVEGNGRYEGRSIIIDGGPDRSDARNALLGYVLGQAHEGAIIDALILTHPHNDHYPGAYGILRHFEVREYYDPGYPKEGPDYNRFLDTVRAEQVEGNDITLRIGRANLGTLDWGSELRAEFLYSWPGPAATDLGGGNTLENNASIVLRLQYRDISFLFMGDAEGKDRSDPPGTPKYAEKILLDSLGPARLRSTVLKLAHHGSETSSTLPFIQAVDPQYIIASSGRRSYGGTFLPDRSTLERYCLHNSAIRVYRTDRDDESEGRTTQTDQDNDHVVFVTNGRVVYVRALSNGQPISPTTCSPN